MIINQEQEKVEVFKTNVNSHAEANAILVHLHQAFPGIRFNFDLWDRDSILRAQGPDIDSADIIQFMNMHFVACTVLPD